VVMVLTECLKDKNERVRRRAMATLGELLFYIATQQHEVGATGSCSCQPCHASHGMPATSLSHVKSAPLYQPHHIRYVTLATSFSHAIQPRHAIYVMPALTLTNFKSTTLCQPRHAGHVMQPRHSAMSLSQAIQPHGILWTWRVLLAWPCFSATEAAQRAGGAGATAANAAAAAWQVPASTVGTVVGRCNVSRA
jgi:hypothetical protein